MIAAYAAGSPVPASLFSLGPVSEMIRERRDQAAAESAGDCASCRIMSAPFSPIMIVAALVLPETTAGMI